MSGRRGSCAGIKETDIIIEIGQEVAQRVRQKGETMQSVEEVAQYVDPRAWHDQT